MRGLYEKLWISLLTTAFMFFDSGPALAKYPQNYVPAKLGAKVITKTKLTGPFEPNALLYPYQDYHPPSISTELLTPHSESPDMIALKVTAEKNTDYIFIAEIGPAKTSFTNGNIQINTISYSYEL